MEKRSTILFIAFLAGTAGGLIALLVDRLVFPAPELARVDLAALITEQITHPGLAHLPDEDRSRHAARFAARFAARIEGEVRSLAKDYNVILLAAPAVVAGVHDLTPVLRTRLGETDDVVTGNQH